MYERVSHIASIEVIRLVEQHPGFIGAQAHSQCAHRAPHGEASPPLLEYSYSHGHPGETLHKQRQRLNAMLARESFDVPTE